MSPERILECAERVRQAQKAEQKLRRLDSKIEAGRPVPLEFRDKLAAKIGRAA